MNYQLRGDLQFAQYQSGGKWQTVVKDPLRLEYFSFAGLEALIIQWLQVPRSVEELGALVRQSSGAQVASSTELQRFLQRLWSDNLLLGSALGGAERYVRQRQQKRSSPWWAWPSQLISIRFRGINPRPLLDGLLPLGWILFHPVTLTLIAIWFAWSILFFVLHLERLIDNQFLWEQMFTSAQVIPLAVAFVLVKVLHELGHALSCRAQGRECHELGILLLLFMPCLYCNVSDIWMEPKTSRRVLVSGAGILVEMLIASICLPLWLLSQPGPLQFFCFQLFLITSVNTLFVNGNPLLKYDGYFVLSDLLGIPNLADRAGRIWQDWRERFLWGRQEVAIDGRQWGWVAYAMAAQIYRWLMLFSVLTLLVTVFRGWSLPQTGLVLLCVMAGSMIVVIVNQIRMQSRQHAGRRQRRHWMRFGIVVIAIALLFATVLALPLQTRIVSEGKTRSTADRFVFATEDGPIEWQVTQNQSVVQGQSLGKIRNPELELELLRAEAGMQVLGAKLKFLEIQRQQGVDTAMELQIAKRLASSQQQLLDTLRQRHEALKLIAPVNGRLRSVPEQATLSDLNWQQASYWNGWLRPTNRGAAVRRGDVLAVIETDQPAQIEISIPSTSLDWVGVGYEAKILIPQLGPRYWSGRVSEVSLERLDPTDAEKPEDPAATPVDEARYRVMITVTEPAPRPRDLSTATVLILGPRRALGRQLLDYLQQNIVLFSGQN